jgi:hypothetical protein
MRLSDYSASRPERPSPPKGVKGVCYLLAVMALLLAALNGFVLYVCLDEGSLKRDAVTFGFLGVIAWLVIWCGATAVLLWRGSRLGLRSFSWLRLLLIVSPSLFLMLKEELQKPDAVRFFAERP